MKTFTTSEIAKKFNMHPNTVRLYEELRFITKPERKKNGYRVFTNLHIEQIVLAKLALKSERNWEMNSLLKGKRKQNGYRIYDGEDIKRLKVIRCLRNAHYSLTAILRLLSNLTPAADTDFAKVIDTPGENEEIISVYDRLITSLTNAEQDALLMLQQIEVIKITLHYNTRLLSGVILFIAVKMQ